MGRDFNCHLREWDDGIPHHRTTPILLVDMAASLGLEYARPENPGHTYRSRANIRVRSIIDLVFVTPDTTLSARVHREVNLQGQSDHILLSATVPLRQSLPEIKGRTLKPFSDEEKEFIANIMISMSDLTGYTPTTKREVEVLASGITDVFSVAWLRHLSEFKVAPNSKEYWTPKCSEALCMYRDSCVIEDYKAFRNVVKKTKHEFFDKHIKEIATTNKCPWDLMDWVRERKNPLCKAIQFNGEPCHNMDTLWDALHNTYNAASNRPVDTSIFDDLPEEDKREWLEFSELELRQALEACLLRSTPGPDHITWRHLKLTLALPFSQ
jgi:hypothetical protein